MLTVYLRFVSMKKKVDKNFAVLKLNVEGNAFGIKKSPSWVINIMFRINHCRLKMMKEASVQNDFIYIVCKYDN
jgi:hypothetical protein